MIIHAPEIGIERNSTSHLTKTAMLPINNLKARFQRANSSPELLFTLIGYPKDQQLGRGLKCPECGTNHLTVDVRETAYFKCWHSSCEFGGNTISFLKRKYNFNDRRQALQYAEHLLASGKFKVVQTSLSQISAPVLDFFEAKQICKAAEQDSMKAVNASGRNAIKVWLERRGFNHVIGKWIGWNRGSFSQLFLNRNGLWVIRVVDEEGKLLALKGHRENRARNQLKGFWWPVGTEPASDPKHGLATLWPRDCLSLQRNHPLFLTEGELKAAAILFCGLQAFSPTSGAMFSWPQNEIERLRGRDVVIVYDDDDAGHKFCNRSFTALKPVCSSVRRITFGRQRNGEKLDANVVLRESGVQGLRLALGVKNDEV